MSEPSKTPLTDAAIWLVWSHEHNAWWRPNSAGYTLHIASAGRYTKAEADRICEDARSPRKFADDPPPEVAVIAPEFANKARELETLANELAEILKELHPSCTCGDYGTGIHMDYCPKTQERQRKAKAEALAAFAAFQEGAR